MNVAYWIAGISFFGIIIVILLEKILDKLAKNQDKKDEALNVKYPKLNFGLSLLVIVFLGSLAFIIYKIVVTSIKSLSVWISTISSKLDAVVIVAMVSGVISITSVVISSVVSKIIEFKNKRKEYLSQKREIPYGDFIELIYRIKENARDDKKYSNEDLINDFNRLSKQLSLWGSPKVVEMWLKFRDSGNSEHKENPQITLISVESIMNQMRKDLGVKKVKEGQLLGFFINDVKSLFTPKKQ